MSVEADMKGWQALVVPWWWCEQSWPSVKNKSVCLTLCISITIQLDQNPLITIHLHLLLLDQIANKDISQHLKKTSILSFSIQNLNTVCGILPCLKILWHTDWNVQIQKQSTFPYNIASWQPHYKKEFICNQLPNNPIDWPSVQSLYIRHHLKGTTKVYFLYIIIDYTLWLWRIVHISLGCN